MAINESPALVAGEADIPGFAGGALRSCGRMLDMNQDAFRQQRHQHKAYALRSFRSPAGFATRSGSPNNQLHTPIDAR